MQKEMKVCSFATAYMGFKQAHELKEDVVGNLIDFKDYMLENGLKIDEKDMLKELYIVGKQVLENEKNKENEMENGKNEAQKMKLKKIDHCTYEGIEDKKTYIHLNSGELKEAEPGHNRESIKEQKMKNRLLGIGVVILLLLMSGNKLYGNDERIHGNLQELKQAQIEILNTVIPKSLDYCSSSHSKPLEEEVEKIIKKFEDQKHWLQLHRTHLEVSRGMIFTIFIFWHHDYTAIQNGKRVLCVPYTAQSRLL